jgi:hypothetical protein
MNQTFSLFKILFISGKNRGGTFGISCFGISCIVPNNFRNFSATSLHSLPKNYFSLEGFCFLDEYFEIENFFENVTVIREKSMDFPYSEFPWEDDITNIHEDLDNYFYKTFLFDYHLTISDEDLKPLKDFSYIYIVFYKNRPKLEQRKFLNNETGFNQYE